jgi:hypothetical protein
VKLRAALSVESRRLAWAYAALPPSPPSLLPPPRAAQGIDAAAALAISALLARRNKRGKNKRKQARSESGREEKAQKEMKKRVMRNSPICEVQ